MWFQDLSRPGDFVYRLRDIVLSLLMMVVTFPLTLIIGLLIKLDSPGPALFKQTRVGQHGEPFTFYKFRTMHVDARDLYPELYAYVYTPEELKTMTFKLVDDPRLTRFGERLRETSLDELPNFINVLKGDMSLVGPRPDIPEMVKYYKDWQKAKFTVKPGITGSAQTNGRGLLTFQETLCYDVQYVQERSFGKDLWILARTIVITLRRIGAF
jgi:lipopolysaccharide/colanic/teichoic acid biosynthesis glycosyltransferase